MSKTPFEDFRNLFPVQKTLCLRLEPVGHTLKTIEEMNFIKNDETFAGNYPVVTGLLNKEYRKALDEILVSEEAVGLPWVVVIDAYRARNEKEGGKERWNMAYTSITSMLRDAMRAHPDFEMLTASTPASLLKTRVLGLVQDEKELEAVMQYGGRAKMLEDFQKNRSQLFVSSKKGSPINRIVVENMPRFEANIRKWFEIREKWDGADAALQAVIESLPKHDIPVEAFFDEGSYGLFLRQDAINIYNALVNGWTEEEVHHKGLKAYVSEACQKSRKGKKDKDDEGLKLPVLSRLHRQVMAENTTVSFVPTQFTSNDEVWSAIEAYFAMMRERGVAEDGGDLLYDLATGGYDKSKVILDEKPIRYLSNKILGDWSAYRSGMAAIAFERWPKAARKREAFIEGKKFTFTDVEDAFRLGGMPEGMTVAGWLLGKYSEAREHLAAAEDAFKQVRATGKEIDKEKEENYKLREAFYAAKEGFDILALLRPERNKKGGKKQDNKTETSELVEDLADIIGPWSIIISLLGKTRAWCTRKPYSEKKFRLWLDNPVVVSGWSWGPKADQVNKTGSMFLEMDDRWYLAIKTANRKTVDMPDGHRERNELWFDAESLTEGEGGATLVVQDKLNCTKQFPQILMAKKNVKLLGTPDDIYDGMHRGLHKGKNADLDFAHRVIAFAQEAWTKHPSFMAYKFPHRDPLLYRSWEEFTAECDEKSYRIGMRTISRSQVEDLVERRRLLLFRLDSPGLRSMYKGHTPSQLQCVYLDDALRGAGDTELCGGAALYFRRKSIETPVVHKAGSWLVRKRLADGTPIPQAAYREIYNYYNYGKDNDMSVEAQQWLRRLSKTRNGIRKAPYDIVKYRRYTEDQFSLHVPVTRQMSVEAGTKDLTGLVNAKVDAWLKEKKDLKVIGINRGENNLLYVTVVDRDGRIIEQRSLNVIHGMDFQGRLNDRVKVMEQARDSWQDMGTIDELKEGYVGEAVREVCDLVYKHEAIIAMEDLDFQFKSGRAQMGQTIYAKFQSTLVDKLRYFEPDKAETGDVLQLSGGVKAGTKDGHNGIVYFVSPWATSSLDPNTGFLNQLPVWSDRADDNRAVFAGMRDVVRDTKGDWHLTFDYGDFKVKHPGRRTLWTVSSKGPRIVVTKDSGGVRRTKTESPSALFDEAVGYDYTGNLRNRLANLKGGSLDNAIRALRLTLQMRNCDVGANEDWFLSPVEGGLDTRSGKAGDPATTDAVTAYNLARKALLTIDGTFVDADAWLFYTQG